MKLINPNPITDSEFVSSTVTEDDYAVYSGATTYAIGDKVIRTETHRCYESLIASNTGNTPEDNLTGTTPAWLDIGPTNRWAMLDDVVGTVTSVTSPLTLVLNPGQTGGIGLLSCVGSQLDVTLKDGTGGTTVYSKTISLDGTIITSWYDWFFEDYVQLSDLVLTDLPDSYTNPELTVSITGTGTVECGLLKTGKVTNMGGTQWGAKVGITDYSRKEQDAFGNYTVVQRSFNKNATLSVEITPSELNRIYRVLATARSTPIFWIGTDLYGFEPLLIYGFYRDFNIDIAYHSLYACSLEIEGLT